MRVAIYARVSTDDKDQDPERQISKCKQYCDIHDHKVVEEIKENHTGDSSPFERPFGRLLLKPEIEGIVIYSMDRLTREHPIKVIRMLGDLKDKGVKVISITEPAFNMESDFADLLLYQITWFNNYFLKKLKRDIRSGMDRAKEKGKHIGRPVARFNKLRAHQLIFEDKLSLRAVSLEMQVPLATLHRFKRAVEKDPLSYKKEGNVSKSDVYGTPL